MGKDDFSARKLHRCSFCGRTQDQVKRMVGGSNAYICNECVQLCHEILADDIAEATGTINYEIVCAFGQRLPKVYVY